MTFSDNDPIRIQYHDERWKVRTWCSSPPDWAAAREPVRHR